jgi:hypothetical protein
VDAWTGSDALRPGARVAVPALRASLDELIGRADAVQLGDLDPTEGPRLTYLRGQLRALSLVTRRLLGETTSFAEELGASFGRIVEVDLSAMTRAHAALDAELAGITPLPERYWAFRRQFLIPEEHVDRVLKAAIDACRAATAPHLALPGDERVDIEFDPTIEWDAYAQYSGNHYTRLKIAGRRGHDVAALLHLACHETYAGHHTQHVLVDDALVKGRGWVEFQLSPAFGPHLFISEGAAEATVDLALPEHARAALYRGTLLTLAGLATKDAERLARVESLAATLESGIPSIVARYLDNQASEESTIAALSSEALIAAPERFLAFAERHRVAAVVYPLGKAAVSQWLAGETDEPQRWLRIRDIFTRKPFTIDEP